MSAPVILWFRQDLRLSDQAAYVAAAADGPVIPFYVNDEKIGGPWAIASAQKWWLHHSLNDLSQRFEKKGLKLILRHGAAVTEVAKLAEETGARAVHALHHYEPWWKDAEETLGKALDLVLHEGTRLIPPDHLRTGTGGRFRMFTPFWKALLREMPPSLPVRAPEVVQGFTGKLASDNLADWNLLPTSPDWAGGFDIWTPGEEGAKAALRRFLPEIEDYDEARNLPSVDGTSRLSPHLHFGEISPATVWHHCAKAVRTKAEPFLRQIAWRDFAANVTDILPEYGRKNGREGFDALHWRTGASADRDFEAWTKGMTGYPIVDAGMRELWATGWMHNRVRMITASFLIKHLLVDWRRGERWFWDTLVDADYGSNAVNWQWVAGTGIDANMFSRIMAPLVQSEKFDAGEYIRSWVPELQHVQGDAIHDPEEAGLLKPLGYPAKIIGHREARERALAAAREVRS